MSNYHVLQVSGRDKAQVAFHVPVPDENNSAIPAVNLRTALSQLVAGQGAVSQVPWLEADFAGEYAQLQNGEVYEHVTTVQYNAEGTDGAKQTAIDGKYAVIVTLVENEIRERFRFWGHNRDVP